MYLITRQWIIGYLNDGHYKETTRSEDKEMEYIECKI